MDIQINRDNANVQNIGNQSNYYINGATGTAFIATSECKEGNYYESVKDSLYYPPQYLEKIVSVLEEEHSILIQGGQGAGKSVLAFYIAEGLKRQRLISSAYYLNPPGDWNAIKQWIQSVHYQEKEGHRESPHLWIIDNLHRIAGAVEDFPDPSVWGRDYCICCTRDLNGIPAENNNWLPPVLSKKQIWKRNVDKEMFLNCYLRMADNPIGRRESDCLYQYIGGNLAFLKYVIESGKLPKSLADWGNEQFIDYGKIYTHYFGYGALDQLHRDNLNDVLKMLFLSQIDFPIPSHLQHNVCQTVLKELYFVTADKELEMEHATLAELLTACICSKFKMNDRDVFIECLHWTLQNLPDNRLIKAEWIRQLNLFLQSLSCYQFVLNKNQSLQEILSSDECFISFLENHMGSISLSVWKEIMGIAEGDSGVNAVFHNFIKSSQLLEAMKANHDYDFQFFRDRLSQDELESVETMLLSYAEEVKESVLNSGNEICLMQLLVSLSGECAAKFVEQLQSCDLVELLSCNQNGLVFFARQYSKLEDKGKELLDAKLSMEDYKNILKCGGSIKGFVYLLSVATDSLRENLCRLLELSPELSEILVNKTVKEGKSIATLGMSLRMVKRNSVEALEAFEKAIGVEGYKRLLESQGTIPALVNIIEYTSEGMQKELISMLGGNPKLLEALVEKTVTEGGSIGTLGVRLRGVKKESEGALEAFERAMGVKGYERLLAAQGTIPVLANIIKYSSERMQKELIGMLEGSPKLVEDLVEKTVTEGSSIGTLDLVLREMKKENVEALEAFERVVEVKGYERLLATQGTIPVLANIIQHSSEGMQKELISMLGGNSKLLETLVEKTVTEGSSIGTLGLILREMKKENAEALEAFERAVGVKGYERLLAAQGTIPALVKIIAYSSEKMQKELISMLGGNPKLVEDLVKKTVTEGSSIGTLGLALREMKKESTEALKAFERAVGVKGYERLLVFQGTIPVLAKIIDYSSERMQKELSSMLDENPKLIEGLVEKTVTEGSSIGTLNFALREMKKKNVEALEAFERAVGVKGYEKLLEFQGTIPILARIIECSSSEMQKELVKLLDGRPELAKILVERTVKGKKSIGALDKPLRALGKENNSSLNILETLIGTDGYLEMFSQSNENAITILRIMACSFISDSLVEKMYANIDIWNESKSYISETSCTILQEFNKDLLYAKKKNREKFWEFLKDMVTTEEWLTWMRQGTILEEAIFILNNLPPSVAEKIAYAWLENNDEMMEGFRSARQHRNIIHRYASQTVNYGITTIKKFNYQLFVLINEEYHMLLENK